MTGQCSTCRNPAPELFKGECRTCYSYRRRTGTERPEDVVMRHASRFNEDQGERKLWSRYSYGQG